MKTTTAAAKYRTFGRQEVTVRHFLDIERTTLANERTLLAYVRTSLTTFVVGGTFIHFFRDTLIQGIGVAFILFALCALAIGFWRFEKVKDAIKASENHGARAFDED
jgi:putative membrane protein